MEAVAEADQDVEILDADVQAVLVEDPAQHGAATLLGWHVQADFVQQGTVDVGREARVVAASADDEERPTARRRLAVLAHLGREEARKPLVRAVTLAGLADHLRLPIVIFLSLVLH